MPRVKIDYIVSFSSEDPDNPASNLLAWDVNKKKWLCGKGESSCSVVLQLNKAVKISSVSIGAHQSALVEVLVGRSETPNEPFQVAVPSCVFQAPGEARRGAPADADKVRSFAADALAASARAQRWDRLRVVCSQPYNKHCKFGLSFVHVFSEEAAAPAPAPPAPAPAPTLAAFSSDEEEFHPGELFARHLQQPSAAADTGAQIRQATSHALKNIPDSSTKLAKASISKPSPSQRRRGRSAGPAAGDAVAGRHGDRLLYTADDDQPNDRIDRVLHTHREQRRDENTDRHRDKHDTSRGDKHDASERPREEPVNKGDKQIERDKHSSKENDDGPSGNGRIDDGSSGNRKKDDRASGNRKKDDRASANGKKDDRASANGKKDDRASSNRRQNDGPSCNRREDDRPSGNARIGDESRKRKHSDMKNDNMVAEAGPPSREPHALLRDVVFVLSGYENPRRARLRTAALALGAACERDWGPRCTHLLCAFPNTPKLREVRAGAGGARAVAVRGDWVEACARARRRLPWQWFATEPARLVPPPAGWDAARPEDLSECDTDDEIEKVRHKLKKRDGCSPASAPAPAPARDADVSGASSSSDVAFVRDGRLQGSVTVVESDSYGDSTDEERSPRAEGARPAACGRLPALFAGRSFAVRAAEPRASLLQRYLRAYGGLLVQEADGVAEYVVCDGAGAGGGGAGAGTRVRAGWVWRCHRERRLCAPDAYLLAPVAAPSPVS